MMRTINQKTKILVCVVCAALAAVVGLLLWKKRKRVSAAAADDAATAELEICKSIGYRINNPLNIRFSPSNNWKGQISEQSGFCVFDIPENGIRAAMVILKNYRKKGVTNIGDIISRWAPPTENDTHSYIDFVCKKLTASAATEILQTREEYTALLQAMCIMEIGCQPYSEKVWQTAADLANL